MNMYAGTKDMFHLAKNHYENFPVGSWLLSRAHRKALYALYAFARTADDFADEPTFEGKRLECLSEWRQYLTETLEGQPPTPFFKELGTMIQTYQLPTSYFYDLLDAFVQDVTVSRYQTWDSIVDYAKKSANPVGRLYLRIHQYQDSALDAHADAICTALQFTNFWQDVSIDLAKDRVYIPSEVMKKHGYDVSELLAHEENQAFLSVIKDLVERTHALFDEGEALLSKTRGRLKIELSMIVQGGRAILEKIQENQYRVLSMRPTLNSKDRVAMFLKALV
ncbi:MAG: squalene synthase HpnC [Bdellovibrionales bacterium]|nr:squalene synthase HpnC [Bdellovibrionales bacterium]